MSDPCPLPPGFSTAEYRNRLTRAQAAMAAAGLDALLLTTEADFRYFTGFLTRFWESPTRPWFLIVPAGGDPTAVIPGIGEALMSQSWISDVRCWSAPDPVDDGVSLLAEALVERSGRRAARIGVPMGQGTVLRMPLADYQMLASRLQPAALVDDAGVMRDLRMIKSPAEIAHVRATCQIADRAFARVPQIASAGRPLDTVFRDFQRLCLEEGADWVPYLAGAAGQGGYADVISPATSQPLMEGDVLMLDTGAVRAGYFCDFDRNFLIGRSDDAVQSAHARLVDAVHAGREAARPGASTKALFAAMAAMTGASGDTGVGRFGHGLGMQLTEPPSLTATDETLLKPGMVLTLEPSIDMGDGRILVHEENIVVEESGAVFLSTLAPAQCPVIA